MMFRVPRFIFLPVLCLSLAVGLAVAQSSPPAATDKDVATPAATTPTPTSASPAATNSGASKATDSQADPLKRPLTEKEKKANAKALKQELGSTYKKWL